MKSDVGDLAGLEHRRLETSDARADSRLDSWAGIAERFAQLGRRGQVAVLLQSATKARQNGKNERR